MQNLTKKEYCVLPVDEVLNSYTELGWKLAFAKPRSKNPGSLMGKEWQHKLASTPEDVEKWLKKCPNANVGVRLGPESGVIDIEYDSDEGRDIVERIIAENPDNKTPTYRSGKSIHRLYRWSDTLPEETCPTYRGIEFRISSIGRALQSILPPSIHPSGKKYEWLPGLSPEEVTVSGMPFELWDLCWYAATRRSQSDQTSVDESGDLYVDQGSRHDWLMRKIFNIAHWGLSESQLTQVAHVLDSEVAHFDPDDRDDRIQKLVRGAIEKRTIEAPEPPSTFAGIPASELQSYIDEKVDWLVVDAFFVGEIVLFLAKSKCGKTMLLTDFVVSLALGRSWMNCDRFVVPKARRTLFITGEANERRAADHLNKACISHGTTLAGLGDMLRVEVVKFPLLPSLQDCEAINRDVEKYGFEVVVLDPVYRGLAGMDLARMNEVAPAIKNFEQACKPATLIYSHHPIKAAARLYGETPEREDATGAGIAESCGQWWLMGRNEKYAYDWKHDLCVEFGGREGQSGGLRINFDESDWRADVTRLSDYIEDKQQNKSVAAEQAQRSKESQKMETARSSILKALQDVTDAKSKGDIEASSGVPQKLFRRVLADMINEEIVVAGSYSDGMNRTWAGWILAENVP